MILNCFNFIHEYTCMIIISFCCKWKKIVILILIKYLYILYYNKSINVFEFISWKKKTRMNLSFNKKSYNWNIWYLRMIHATKISFQFVCTTSQASPIVCDGLLPIFYSSLININICSIGTFIIGSVHNDWEGSVHNDWERGWRRETTCTGGVQ